MKNLMIFEMVSLSWQTPILSSNISVAGKKYKSRYTFPSKHNEV
jgi:hypothetical protein